MTISRSSSALVLTITFACLALMANQALAQGNPEWQRYHSSAEAHALLASWARKYPQLARLRSIGKSFSGSDLWLLEVTDFGVAGADDKPALYVDGNIHSGELTGAEVVLHLARKLLEGYGRQQEITALLRTHTFYLRPKFNPDGADLALLKGVSLRSTPRPQDNDGDGVADEDPPEDLNGDGFITRMRVPDPKGEYAISTKDPRLMVRRKGSAGTGPFFRMLSEGRDNDGDGRINEDGVGGLDLNRNFPRNWALPFKQPGAGPYPLSESETRATVQFIVAHPNITGIVHGHTSGGFVFRLPSASDPAAFDQDDLTLIKHLGKRYTETTGRPVRPSSTHATRHRYGTLISWAYWDRGIVGWVPEYWPGLAKTDLEALRVNDQELQGRYFIPWKPFEHPQLGRVEIGGWRSRFVRQNPPPEMLAGECEKQLPWILYLARQSPRLTMTVTSSAGEDGTYILKARIQNVGFLPTHLTRRGATSGVVQPVVVTIDLGQTELVEGQRRTSVGHLSGSWAPDNPQASKVAQVRWVIRSRSPGPHVKVLASAPSAGQVRVDLKL